MSLTRDGVTTQIEEALKTIGKLWVELADAPATQKIARVEERLLVAIENLRAAQDVVTISTVLDEEA